MSLLFTNSYQIDASTAYSVSAYLTLAHFALKASAFRCFECAVQNLPRLLWCRVHCWVEAQRTCRLIEFCWPKHTMQNTYQHMTRSKLSYILSNLMSGSGAAQWSSNWIFLRGPAGSQVENFINKAAWMTQCVGRTICQKLVMKMARNILKENESKIATHTVCIVPHRHSKWTDGWQRPVCPWRSYVKVCECFTDAIIDPVCCVT